MMMGIPGLGLLTGGFGKLKEGLGSLNETLGDFREKTTGFRTQAEYEAARQQRQLQSRLDNLYDRKAKGKGFSQKNIDMLESQYGLTPSRDTITSAINRDLQINPETPQFARSYLQTINRPTQTFNFDSSRMTKNNLPSNNLVAGLTKMQQKMLAGPQKNLRDIMGISDQEILDNISPFNDPEDPATLEEVQTFYGANGGLATMFVERR